MKIYQDNNQQNNSHPDQNSGNNNWSNGWSNNWPGNDPLQQNRDFSNSPYDAQESLSSMSLSVGIAALITSAFMTVIIPLILAPVSITLAVISKGRSKKLKRRAKNAIIVSTLAITVNFMMIITSIFSLFNNPQTRANVNQIMSMTYGITVEQEIEALDAQFGTNLTSLLRGDSSQYGTEQMLPGAATEGENIDDEIL